MSNDIKMFEVWEYNGIPQDAPVLTTTSLQEVREYLELGAYQFNGNFYGGEGEKVFYQGKEIPLDAIFSDDDFYSTEAWKKIVGE